VLVISCSESNTNVNVSTQSRVQYGMLLADACALVLFTILADIQPTFLYSLRLLFISNIVSCRSDMF
jgi:hypothetical protein